MTRLGAMAAVAVLLPAAALAHGVTWGQVDVAAQVVEFRYADGEAMSFADVIVSSPDGAKAQTGRTDAWGRFAFVAAVDGVWRAEADDGQGHAITAKIEVAAGKVAAPAVLDPFLNASIREGWIVRTLLGISLIANLGLVLRWRRR